MIEIVTQEVTLFAQNCRILFDTESKRAVVIDPGGDVDKIMGLIAQHGLVVEEVWLTHSHLDHCGGVRGLLAKTSAVLKGHQVEAEMRAAVLTICNLYGMPPGDMDACPEPHEYLQDGDVLTFAGQEFHVLFTPGHSPGHVCFYLPSQKLLFAGDTVFAGSIGRTDLPGGNHEQLLRSIESKILSLPDDTRVLPGHGPETTVGAERKTNPFLQ